MKYIVDLSYTVRRKLVVHAANPEIAKKKAARIVEGWHDASTPTINAVKEDKTDAD